MPEPPIWEYGKKVGKGAVKLGKGGAGLGWKGVKGVGKGVKKGFTKKPIGKGGAMFWVVLLALIFAIPLFLLTRSVAILIIIGVVLVSLIIIMGIKSKSVSAAPFSPEWFKAMTGKKTTTAGAIILKLIGILLLSVIVFLVFSRVLPPLIAFWGSVVFAIILLLIFLGAPQKIFRNIIIVIAFPVGFWILSMLKAPPIASAVFIIVYLIILPIAWGGFGWVVTILGSFAIILFLALAPDINIAGTGNALADTQAGFMDMGDWFQEQWEKVTRGAERTLAGTFGEGYFEGEVQEAADKKLGVFITEFKSISPSFNEGENILLYGQITAETMGEKPITVKIDCTLDEEPANEIISESEFTVLKSDLKYVDCKFKGEDFKAGNYRAKLSTTFDFTTNAFIKAYFMDKDKLREFKMQNINPAERFGFEEHPTAVYSAGPIMIGMSLGKMPLGISEDSGDGPTIVLMLTIENLWLGKIKNIRNLTIISPGEVKPGSLFSSAGEINPTCEGCEKGSEECVCSYKLGEIFEKEKNILTMRIPTTIIDANTLLGTAPVSFKTFKLRIDYDYINKKEIGVKIRSQQLK